MSQLQFDAAAHVYRFGGVVVPSVTQIISPLYSFDGIPEEVLEAKRALGWAVHAACEYDDQDDLDEDTVADAVRPYLEAYRRFKADVSPKVLMNEQKLFSQKHRYAGTIDRRMLIANEVWTIDLKTTAAMSPAVGVQLAAYDRLAQDEGGVPSKMGALQLMKDGSYKLHPFKGGTDFTVFLSLVNLHNWKTRHGKR